MKENSREIPTKKYPENNIPLKDPDPRTNDFDDPKNDSGKNKQICS